MAKTQFLNAKINLTQFLAENYFPLHANDCSVNLSDLSKMLVKKMKTLMFHWTMHGNIE